jgi:hypothetical protein
MREGKNHGHDSEGGKSVYTHAKPEHQHGNPGYKSFSLFVGDCVQGTLAAAFARVTRHA